MQVEVVESEQIVSRWRLVACGMGPRDGGIVAGHWGSLSAGSPRGLVDLLLSAWWRRIVGAIDVGVLNPDEKGKLSSVCNNRYKQDLVASRHQRNAIVPCIPYRIHGMGSHLENTVEGKLLIDEEEEVTPVPGKVLDNTVGIELDPEIEQEQGYSSHPA